MYNLLLLSKRLVFVNFLPSIYSSNKFFDQKSLKRLLKINSDLKEGKCCPLNAPYMCVPVGCSDTDAVIAVLSLG